MDRVNPCRHGLLGALLQLEFDQLGKLESVSVFRRDGCGAYSGLAALSDDPIGSGFSLEVPVTVGPRCHRSQYTVIGNRDDARQGAPCCRGKIAAVRDAVHLTWA